ncbi:hypothetical protein SB778_03805 [Paraburkholderia sp. SIMBA_050]
MTARMLMRAISAAEDPKNNGDAYTLDLHMRSGRRLHGAVVDLDHTDSLLRLEIWEAQKSESDPEGRWPQPTRREILIDANAVESVEVCW